MDKPKRIRELTDILNSASKAYYSDDAEIMTNYEYDNLYDELCRLEEETGIILSNSPTQKVGFEAVDELVKEAHESPMLSLDKTKDREVLSDFLGNQKGLLSWKLDGLTVVLTYSGGALQKAVTRGNGEIGEVVTANAKTFVNVPLTIPYKGYLIVRGEAVIKYSDFEKINNEIPDAESRYKNPRNLCSGSVRQLDPVITAGRCVNFYVFSLEKADDENNNPVDFNNSNEEKFIWLKNLGFDVVPYAVVTNDTVVKEVAAYAEKILTYDVPSDGLVLLLDDIAFGQSLGRTSKYPKNAIAFKWQDETAETTLLEVEWSPSRTGLINPVAIFEPVELEGTTVSRASLHNLSIIEGLEIGIGDRLLVYKANMIIPQIAENLTRSNRLLPACQCPACGGPTIIKNDNGTKTLVCTNSECPAKKIKSFSDFVSRNAMNVEGISEETLEKFIGHGFISVFADIFRLEKYQDEIINLPGFGRKSYENIIASVNKARQTTAQRVLNALGISGIGSANAKQICRYFGEDLEKISQAREEELLEIEGIGDVLAKALVDYFTNRDNRASFLDLLSEIQIQKEGTGDSAEKLKGLTFVITGSLEQYENRDALKNEIESFGGKVSGSVSSKTSFLINNDINSSSSKNKNAKKLGIPIITEYDYMKMISE